MLDLGAWTLLVCAVMTCSASVAALATSRAICDAYAIDRRVRTRGRARLDRSLLLAAVVVVAHNIAIVWLATSGRGTAMTVICALAAFAPAATAATITDGTLERLPHSLTAPALMIVVSSAAASFYVAGLLVATAAPLAAGFIVALTARLSVGPLLPTAGVLGLYSAAACALAGAAAFTPAYDTSHALLAAAVAAVMMLARAGGGDPPFAALTALTASTMLAPRGVALSGSVLLTLAALAALTSQSLAFKGLGIVDRSTQPGVPFGVGLAAAVPAASVIAGWPNWLS